MPGSNRFRAFFLWWRRERRPRRSVRKFDLDAQIFWIYRTAACGGRNAGDCVPYGESFNEQRQQHLHGEHLLRSRLVELAAHGVDQLVAGLQADAVALHPGAGMADAVCDGDGQLVPVATAGDGDSVNGLRSTFRNRGLALE